MQLCQQRLAGCETRSTPSPTQGARWLPKARHNSSPVQSSLQTHDHETSALCCHHPSASKQGPASLMAKNKVQTVPLRLRTPKLCAIPAFSRSTVGDLSARRGEQTLPGWKAAAKRAVARESFYSEPHLSRSPAPGCFPRTCFNFSGMEGGRGGLQRPPFWGAAFWHYDHGLSALRQ